MKRILTLLPPWILTVAVSAAILYLTLVPRPVPEDMSFNFPGIDKAVHGIMFAALAGAIVTDSLRRSGHASKRGTRTALTAALISTAAGGLIELAQRWMGLGRGCETLDFVADAIGACLGGWIGLKIFRRIFSE